jgi:hypothetical protein
LTGTGTLFTQILGWTKEDHEALLTQACEEIDNWRVNHTWIDV